MLCVVEDGVGRAHRFSSGGTFFAGVEIPVETREIAAADLKPQAMAFAENIAGRPHVQGELVRLAGIHEVGLQLGIAVSTTDYAFGKVLREAIRPYIHQLAVKSVSTAEELAKSSSLTGPVTSRSCARGGVE